MLGGSEPSLGEVVFTLRAVTATRPSTLREPSVENGRLLALQATCLVKIGLGPSSICRTLPIGGTPGRPPRLRDLDAHFLRVCELGEAKREAGHSSLLVACSNGHEDPPRHADAITGQHMEDVRVRMGPAAAQA